MSAPRTPQVFGPGVNTLVRITLIGAAFVLVGAAGALYLIARSPYVTAVGVPVDQPVPFSHKHHVTDDGIDCRYCHTTAETSSFAGVPSTQTCMNCHSQIWAQSPALEPVRESFRTGQPIEWNRVHQLPDFVYFDHSIHVQKGIGCASCHGQVEQMPLTSKSQTLQMDFCLECHRNPGPNVRPREEITNMNWQPPANRDEQMQRLVQEYLVESKTSCSTCHR